MEKLKVYLRERITQLKIPINFTLPESVFKRLKDINKNYKSDPLLIKDYIYQLAFILLKFLLIALLFFDNIFIFLIVIPYLIVVRHKIKNIAVNKMKKRIRNQFSDGMQAVAFSLNVGYSIENAFYESIGELNTLYGKDSLMVKSFKEINHRIRRNERIEDVLEDMAMECDVEEIKYFSQVIKQARRSGGDLIGIIKRTVLVISQKNEVEKSIDVLISGKKLEQKIMEAVPFVVLVYIRISSPEFISILYHNVLGVLVMLACTVVYFFAGFLADKIIDIRV